MKFIEDICGDLYPLKYSYYWSSSQVRGRVSMSLQRFIEDYIDECYIGGRSKYMLGYTKDTVDSYLQKNVVEKHIENLKMMADSGILKKDDFTAEDLKAMILQSYSITVEKGDAKGIRDCAVLINDMFNVTGNSSNNQSIQINIDSDLSNDDEEDENE
jgi:hypothetical protein